MVPVSKHLGRVECASDGVEGMGTGCSTVFTKKNPILSADSGRRL